MLRHWLVATWRVLRSDRTFSLITVLSLALGCGASVLVGAYLQEELNYESWLPAFEDVGRVEMEITPAGQTPFGSAVAFGGFDPIIRENVDDVDALTRVRVAWFTVKRGAELFNQQVSFVGSEFFDVFELPVVNGDPKAALRDPLSVVITESVAERHFGDEDPVGQTMLLLPRTEVTVRAVLEDLPETTHLAAEIIAPADSPALALRLGPNVNLDDEFSQTSVFVYLRAEPGRLDAVRKRLEPLLGERANSRLAARTQGPPTSVDVRLTPIGEIHTGVDLRGDSKPTADTTKLALFAAVALALLVVSGFNYMTMSLARAASRAREVGLRKALGADQSSVARFYLGESAAFTLLSVLIGFAIAELALPWFAQAVGRELEMSTLHSPAFVAYALVCAILLSLIVGAYPALYLARQPAVAALQGRIASGRGVATFSGGLVIVQFGAATALLALVFVMLLQVDFVATQPLGFERSDRLVVFGGNYGPQQTGPRYETFKRILTGESSVRSVSASGSLPNWDQSTDGTLEADWAPEAGLLETTYLPVGLDFTEAMGTTLLAGRHFDDVHGTDRTYLDKWDATPSMLPVILTRSAVEYYSNDLESVIGKTLNFNTDRYKTLAVEVVGVVEDVHYRSLREKTEPMVFIPDPRQANVYIVHIDPAQREGAVAATKRAWSEAYPSHLISFSYFDEEMAKLYDEDRELLRLITGFGLLAIVVACLGLYGLTAFAAKRRTREIGIRKALGANRADVMRLMLSRFTRPALVAVAIATPVSVWLGYRWLEEFAFRVSLGIMPFVGAALIVSLVAAIAVMSNAWRASSVPAADALRYE